jgi:hypothetical protein
VSLANMKSDLRVFSTENKLGNTVIGYDITYLHDGNSILIRKSCDHLSTGVLISP